MPRGKKIIFDVNVWLAIFLDRELYIIKKLIIDGDNLILRSPELTAELMRVMKFKKFNDRWETSLNDCLLFFEDYTVNFVAEALFVGCSDKDDNFLFDLAIQTGADYLVSRDKTVQKTLIHQPTEIINYEEFKKLFF